MTRSEFESWIDHRVPPGLTVEEGGGSVQPSGEWEGDIQLRSPSTDARTSGVANLAYTAYPGGLVVRVDTFVGARFARTVRIPEDVTSVEILHRVTAPRLRSAARVVKKTVTEPAAVGKLVGIVNRLSGAMTVPDFDGCPGMLETHVYRFTLTAPRGVYVAEQANTGCHATVTLFLDGQAVGPVLEADSTISAAADRYAGKVAGPRR